MRDSIRSLFWTAVLAAVTFTPAPATAQTAVVSITGGTVTEGDAGTTTVTFNVVCDPCASVNAIVDWATVDGTATTANSDYVARSGQIDDLGNGAERETYPIAVTVNGDTAVEGDETFSLRVTSASVGCPSLGGPGGCPASPTAATATATIVNDDTEAPPPPDRGLPWWLVLLILLLLLLILYLILKKKSG